MVWTDYLLALPITLLALFALGILLIDFMLPRELKWANAVTAIIGVMFSAAGVYKIQLWLGSAGGAPGMLNTPDGFDLLMADGSTPTHRTSG